MLTSIKHKINAELERFAADIDSRYSLHEISPLLTKNIQNFILRPGKRARPILFVVGYLGFSNKVAQGLYKSSLSIELLHDFLLVHDDIIDKSDTRRGSPSMHKMLNNYLSGFKNIKFNGQDLAIVIADIIYAMAIDAFLFIQEEPARKERALKKLLEATIYTGGGEFIELIYGAQDIEKITKQDIYKIYNNKTAHYTFASPLSIGAILAGTDQTQIDLISKFGLYLGNAFQIKDDLLGIFGEESKTGKSSLVDLQEAKKTILIWYAYKHAKTSEKSLIKKILAKSNVVKSDLTIIREITLNSGAKEFAENEIALLTQKAMELIASSKIRKLYKDFLYSYPQEILT